MALSDLSGTEDLGAADVLFEDTGPEVVRRGWLASHPLASYAIRRIGLYFVTLWGSITATFFFFHLIPGNPIEAFLINLQETLHSTNIHVSKEVIAHYNKEFGLNGSIFTQYYHYMYQLFIRRTMGPSLIAYPTSSQQVIANAIPWTIGLLGLATVISFVVGLLFGAIVGWKPRSWWSSWLTNLSIAISHIPFYFLALIGLFFLAYHFAILPASYAYALNLHVAFNGTFILSVIRHGILPALSIVVVSVAGSLISVRQLMIPVVGEDYLAFAEAKGLKPRRILTRYALRNCYLPAMTGFGISLGFIFSGNVLIEQLFDYPGVGHLYVQAIQELDFDTALGITIIAIFTVLTANLIIDFFLPLLDPRVKYAK